MKARVNTATGLKVLKAVAEITRFRILKLLQISELTVKDLTHLLGQSQPRLSRHLKLLHEAGLVERHREGSWVYFRLVSDTAPADLLERALQAFDVEDPDLHRDAERLRVLFDERATAAQAFFEENAAVWDRLRTYHVDDSVVEAAMHRLLGEQQVDFLVDLGTGTGRILELFKSLYRRGLGIDINQAMLGYARSRLTKIGRRDVQVRLGDICNLSMAGGVADVVIMHQVLHHLRDPLPAIAEAGRILAPSGRLMIVDFAPHDFDVMREEFAHQRLGFSQMQMKRWFADADLQVIEQMTLKERECGDPATSASERERLTVMIWLARRSRETSARKYSRHAQAMEVMQ